IRASKTSCSSFFCPLDSCRREAISLTFMGRYSLAEINSKSSFFLFFNSFLFTISPVYYHIRQESDYAVTASSCRTVMKKTLLYRRQECLSLKINIQHNGQHNEKNGHDLGSLHQRTLHGTPFVLTPVRIRHAGNRSQSLAFSFLHQHYN